MKGKIFNENDNIIYELINVTGNLKGNYLDDKFYFDVEYLNGNRREEEYWSNGIMLFECEYLND